MRWLRRVVQKRPSIAQELPSIGVTRNVFDVAAREQGFALDSAQLHAIDQLISPVDSGIYLWGPVGRGKSWLMETYFGAVRTDRKIRIHFHEFFRDLHSAIRIHQNNLGAAIDHLLDGVDVVCFDEFHVHDPADGMFIGRLLPALIERDVLLVITSNYPPDGLLPNPLFHQDFVPTIDLIKRSLTVVAVDGPTDYRTISDHTAGFASGAWVAPAGNDQLDKLGLRRPQPSEYRHLSPAGHAVRALRADSECLWFDFADLCAHTTAPADYLALVSEYPRWVISGIPDLHTAGSEPSQRFANLIDILYDHDVQAVLLSDRPLEYLTVTDSQLPTEICRVLSRLGQLRTIRADCSTTL